MKKNNLLISFVFVAMAVLVVLGSAFRAVPTAAPLTVQAVANHSAELFDSKGNYVVTRTAIVKGAVFNFFGYDWEVVYVNDARDVATFWMVNPYTTAAFNQQTAAGVTQNENNTWHNGYSNSVWQGYNLGECSLRTFLNAEAGRIIDGYKYKNKVVAGFVAGSNSDNNAAAVTINNGVYYANAATNDFVLAAGQNMTSSYNLATNQTNDRLWLPSIEEICDGGLWGLTNSDRNWDNTTYANLAWLRTANKNTSLKGTLVGYQSAVFDGRWNMEVTNAESIFTLPVDRVCGVRPAIHLNIASAGGAAVGSTNSGWFTDDMMKVFFIIVCVIGIIGIMCVLIAVLRRSSENKGDRQPAKA